MSDREPDNTPAQDLHRILFQAMRGFSVDDRLNALAACAAEIIVANAPALARVKWQRLFADEVRRMVNRIAAAFDAMRVAR